MKAMHFLSFSAFLLLYSTVYAQTNTFPSSGNVGIGTTSPLNRLEVSGNTFNRVTASVTSDVQTGFHWQKTGSNETSWELYVPSGSTALRLYNTGDKFTFLPNGNMGIGTMAPADRLDLGKGGNLRIGSSYYGNNGILRFYGTDDAEKLQLGAIGNNAAFIYTPSSVDLNIYTGNVPRMTIRRDGNVGIGTNDPIEKLDVRGNVFLGDGSTDFNASINGVYGVSWGWNLSSVASGFRILSTKGGATPFNIDADGNVGIGTTNAGVYKLAVNGNIKAKKITVTQTGWPDYVFDKNYSLMPLHQVEKFIETNKHLPGVPSAKEVEDKGVNLGDNQALLLKKIEELTLYLIEIKKTNDRMQEKIALQEKEIDILKKGADGKSGN